MTLLNVKLPSDAELLAVLHECLLSECRSEHHQKHISCFFQSIPGLMVPMQETRECPEQDINAVVCAFSR